MPLEIQRTVLVYRLWDDDDVRAVCEDHAAAGWLAMKTCALRDGAVEWHVSLQNAATRQQITAPTSDVIVSDLVTVVAQNVEQYNAANPDNQISQSS